ncbi:unnamed protein product [Gongylonema pulchrum]|uniref:DWNN domain-containing protein n=1 Tax=Gongylonema pulchrum TaxID=637853 RepID=A0A183DFV1_9BILA|nr:unnamed protein product [Gongylonema pulchrum]
MATKLTDVFKSLRVIPVPFGEYCRSGGANDELPSIMTDYRLPSAHRTVRIVLKSDQCLFIDRDTISRNSRICAAEIERQEKEGAEVVIRLENVFLHHMERVLFAISPTVYGQYPIPPTIFDVCAICPVAQALEMDMLVSLCQQVTSYFLLFRFSPARFSLFPLWRLANILFKYELAAQMFSHFQA